MMVSASCSVVLRNSLTPWSQEPFTDPLSFYFQLFASQLVISGQVSVSELQLLAFLRIFSESGVFVFKIHRLLLDSPALPVNSLTS